MFVRAITFQSTPGTVDGGIRFMVRELAAAVKALPGFLGMIASVVSVNAAGGTPSRAPRQAGAPRVVAQLDDGTAGAASDSASARGSTD